MKWILIFLLIFSFKSIASEYNPSLIQCHKPNIKLREMNDLLVSVKTKKLGNYLMSIAADSLLENDATKITSELSRKIQKEAFGSEVIKIEFFPEGYSFHINESDGNIRLIVSVGFVQHLLKNPRYKNGKNLLALMIAHEISHIVQMLTEEPSQLTVNGNMPDWPNGEAFIKKMVVDEVKRRNGREYDNLSREVVFKNFYLYNHQEVDVFALLILEKLGIKSDAQDYRKIFEVIRELKAREEKSELGQGRSPLEKRYDDELIDCFIDVRINYIDQFKKDVRKLGL